MSLHIDLTSFLLRASTSSERFGFDLLLQRCWASIVCVCDLFLLLLWELPYQQVKATKRNDL